MSTPTEDLDQVVREAGEAAGELLERLRKCIGRTSASSPHAECLARAAAVEVLAKELVKHLAEEHGGALGGNPAALYSLIDDVEDAMGVAVVPSVVRH